MKVFIYILFALAVVIIGVNITKIDPAHLLSGDSSIAVIGILAGLCTIVLLSILLISQRIAAKAKK
jgi:hypothetical protein